MSSKGFIYELGSDGVAVVTMDMRDQPVNTMNDEYISLMSNVLSQVKTDICRIKGVIFTSAKRTFFAGGDIATIKSDREEQAWDRALDLNLKIKRQLSELETIGVPVVAAINGAAMGGGFELCLACHRRIALSSRETTLGFPEVTLGLLPAAGGIVRTVRLIGIEKSFAPLMEGKKYTAQEALELGLVDQVASTKDEMINDAKDWIFKNQNAAQPWLVKGYKIPGGDAFAPNNAMMLSAGPAIVRKKTKGLLPAPEAILSVISESTMCGYQSAMMVETRYFMELLKSPEAGALINTMYYQMNEISAGQSRPKNIEKTECKKVAILGAGMMGRGIAYVTAKAGIEVVLKDTNLENAALGKEYCRNLLDKQISSGRMSEEKSERILSLIHPSENDNDLKDADLIIEAVFEDLDLKLGLTKATEPFLNENAIWGSNTSTLPIGLLSEGLSDAKRFIGVHFFSPADRMPLVEIITGELTSDETIARAYDYVRQIKKTPIVVRDGRGFYTSRVFGCYIDEGLHMISEGVDPVLIENAAKSAGMAVGPLAVMDEVELELMRKVGVTNKELDERLGENFCKIHSQMQAHAIKMCDMGRSGRSVKKGWYDYFDDGSKVMWPGIKEMYGGQTEIPFNDIIDRLLFRQVTETLDCVHRSILSSSRDANIGSIFGWAFPAHTGGAIHFIDWFGGRDAFEVRRSELVERYGARFELPDSLNRILAAIGE